jgi:hypothetical protein
LKEAAKSVEDVRLSLCTLAGTQINIDLSVILIFSNDNGGSDLRLLDIHLIVVIV